MNSPDSERAPESPEADTDTPVHFPPPAHEELDSSLHSPAPTSSERFPVPYSGLPADSDTPLKWADLVYLVLFYVVSGELLGLLVMGAATVFFHIPFKSLQDLAGPGAAVAVISQFLLSLATLAFLYVVVRGRSAAPFWPAVGWHAFRNVTSRAATTIRYVLLGFGLAMVVSLASRYMDTDKTLPMEELFRNRDTVVMLMLLGILVAPLIEETLFRGCLYPLVARSFGIPAGIIVTGIVFGLAHAPQLWGGWGQIALLMGVGTVLTYIRARAGTVAASYFVHVSYNTILFAGLFFATGGLRHFPPT